MIDSPMSSDIVGRRLPRLFNVLLYAVQSRTEHKLLAGRAGYWFSWSVSIWKSESGDWSMSKYLRKSNGLNLS